MKSETESKLNELAVLEKNINFVLSQKHSLRNQILEVDSALKELESSSQSFKIIGFLMVSMSKDKIKKDLIEKKSSFEEKINHLSSREKELKDRANKLQEVVMGELGE
ncbi:MAG: prefoldin subunit [Candidatus Woesearchaeota archaeon]